MPSGPHGARLHTERLAAASQSLRRPASSESPGAGLLNLPPFSDAVNSFPEEGQHARLSFVCSMQGYRSSPLSQSSPSVQLSQRRACRLSPLVPTRSHDHWLRFLGLPSGRTNSADILWTPRARLFGALRILDSACSFVVCKLGLSCVSTHRLHSSIALFVRGPLAPL